MSKMKSDSPLLRMLISGAMLPILKGTPASLELTLSVAWVMCGVTTPVVYAQQVPLPTTAASASRGGDGLVSNEVEVGALVAARPAYAAGRRSAGGLIQITGSTVRPVKAKTL